MNIQNCFAKGNRYNLISTNDDSCDDIIAAFIAYGVNNGYKCMYFVDNISFDRIEFFLGNYDLDITGLITSRQLVIRSAVEFYIEKKAFTSIANLQNIVDEAISEGYSGAAVISDRNCFYENGTDDEIIYAFEKVMQDFYKSNPAIALTSYNIDKFGVDAVFALSHLNSHFIYKRDDDIYIHDRENDLFTKEETLGIVFNFLKKREKLINENKVHQFISELSSEISYKKEEREIVETSLASICRYSRAEYGLVTMLKNNHLDRTNTVQINVKPDIMEVFFDQMDNAVLHGVVLSKIFDKVNYLIIDTDETDASVKHVLQRYDIKYYILLPLRADRKICGYIWLATNKQYISFKENADFLYKSCEKITKMITEFRRYKRIQDTLLKAREMKALGELTGGIVHEFNNVLTPILGYTQILRGKVKDPILDDYINLIEESARDGAKIVKRIQEYAKIKEKVKEPVDIDKAILQCVEITKPRWAAESQIQRKFIDIQLELKSGCIVQGVPTEVREIFVNLISNAVDAMPDGGRINIISYRDEDEAVIKIHDNGIGIDDEVKKRIFEPFFTTKYERGNGLGLPIVLSIIKDMGGSIEVDSKKDNGTEFTVRIPVCIVLAKTNIIKTENKKVKGLKIFIIDDQEAVAKTICEMLKILGHDVVFTTSEKDAVNIFTENDFDCVLCDLAMPKTTGIQLSEKLGKLKEGIPFILMTGWLGKLKESNLTYVNEIIQKPFSLEEIEEVICRVTERPVN